MKKEHLFYSLGRILSERRENIQRRLDHLLLRIEVAHIDADLVEHKIHAPFAAVGAVAERLLKCDANRVREGGLFLGVRLRIGDEMVKMRDFVFKGLFFYVILYF